MFARPDWWKIWSSDHSKPGRYGPVVVWLLLKVDDDVLSWIFVDDDDELLTLEDELDTSSVVVPLSLEITL